MGLSEDFPSTSDGSETGFETGGSGSDDFPTNGDFELPLLLDVRGTDLSGSSTCIPEFSAALQRVNLAACRLTSVPPEIFCCARNLTTLNLSLNNIRTLSPKFGRFCRLRILFADFNEFNELPAELGCLHDLQLLSLKGNRLRSLPRELCHLAHLLKLSLSANRLVTSPEALFPMWTHLQHLDLRKNLLNGAICFNAIPTLRYLEISENRLNEVQLDNLHELEYIDCSHNHLNVFHLTSQRIVHLNVSHNKLSSITASINVSTLEFLDASNNELCHCPEWICQNDQLSYLDLSHNLISQIHNKILSFRRLDTLRLGHNRLRRLEVEPSEQCLLRHLDIQHNYIGPSLPDELLLEAPRLEWLNASWNQLKHLPTISGFQLTLRWLVLSHNALLDDAWSYILCCPKLKVLKLSFNRFETLPKGLSDLTQLRDIHLSGNNILSLPPLAMSELETLLLDCNRLTEVPRVDCCPALRRLDISCNVLSEIPLPNLISRSLEILDIACNQDLFIDSTEFQQLCGDRNVSVVDTKFSGRLGPFSVTDRNPQIAKNQLWTTGFSESDRGHSRLYINQCSQNGAQSQEVILAICESYVKPAVCGQAKAFLADLIRDMRRKRQNGDATVGALSKINLALQKMIHECYKEIEQQACTHQMALLLCHITPSESDPGSVELTVLHTGVMACIIGAKDNATNIIQDSNVHWNKFCSYDEWKRSVEGGFSSHNREGCEFHHCEAIPQPVTRTLKLKVCDTSVILFSTCMLTEALSAEDIIKEFHVTTDTVAGAKRLNDAVSSLVSDRGTSVIAIDLRQSKLRAVAAPQNDTQQGKPVRSQTATNVSYTQIRPKLRSKCVHFQELPLRSNSLSSTVHTRASIGNQEVRKHKDFSLNVPSLQQQQSSSPSITSKRHWRHSKLLNEFPENVQETYKAWEYVLEENHKMIFNRELETLARPPRRTLAVPSTQVQKSPLRRHSSSESRGRL
ncbi:PH domain leucine-rich repeat-containing protein phosphatase 2-like [Varroa destructor]|uniref:Uncharacterized protein n=1 Tax=Varroa destructor TaxID=109461 RepID=A0A7M7JYI7_VARDE|nr:PH domain leucine-rich repeat-containing protein phosphatase 2-like [Varroa destructor]